MHQKRECRKDKEHIAGIAYEIYRSVYNQHMNVDV